MAIGTEEALLGGVEARFVIDVSAAGVEVRNSSVDAFTNAWREAAAYSSSAATAILIGTATVAVLGILINWWLLIPIIVAGAGLFAWATARAANARRVAVAYQLDDAARLAFDSVSNGLRWLQNSRVVWRVTNEQLEQRQALTPSIVRVPASIRHGDVVTLLTNVAVPTIVAAGETLYFLPDALYVRELSGAFVHVLYSSIRVDLDLTQFSESETAPSDSRCVGSSWVYANKDGSPDRRRANNRRLPILEYARVTLSWRRSGCVLMISSVGAARHFAESIRTIAALRESKPRVAQAPPAVTPEVKMPLHVPTAPTDLMRVLQDSIDRRKRLEELERSRQPAAPPSATSAEWLTQGRTASVHGFATGDFVYVGTRLMGLDGSRVEPALIDSSLAVDPVHANVHGEQMTYWPSYDSITAASRRAYLQWLAGGRRDPNAYIGYVFLFFYGLERRVYEFIQSRGSSSDEVLAIAREVARLFDLYARTSSSFANYAGSFVDLIGCVEPRARALAQDRASLDGPPMSLRVTLGELALSGGPIPAQHALAWVRTSHPLTTPATRCAKELELLFHIRYAKKFGEGLRVKPGKTSIELVYRPASATLDPITIRRNIPDVTLLARPVAQLIGLAEECCAALDAFSRFLGKVDNGRESLAAFALLPEELVEATPSSDATALASLVRSRLDEDGRAPLAAAELLQHVRLAKAGKVSKNEAMLLAQALEKLGYGIEPDVRVGGPVYDVEGRVVVFRRLPDCPSVASDAYASATLLMRLATIVSTADDEVSPAERELLERHVEERLQLTAGERQRLGAHLSWLVEANLGMTGLRKKIAGLSPDARRAIGRVLVDVAATDGHVDAREMKILEKLYATLDLESGDLYRAVHAGQVQNDEPVPVDTSSARTGFAIPPKPVPAATKSGIDMDRVRMKIAETRQVSSLLSSIFIEEESAPVVFAPAIKETNTIGTLDAAHSELLRRLGMRESWQRDEVERLTGELALMTDGALETINDYAYTTVDEPLWEDDDPISINSKVAMELTA